MRFLTRLSIYLWFVISLAGEIFGADPAVTDGQQAPDLTPPHVATAPAPSAQPRAAPDEPSDALKQYIAKADTSYHWTKRREGPLGKGTYVELTLTSQTWRDIQWKHQLFIY